jgi:hypothetical protein
MEMKTIWVGVLGMALGVAGAVGTRSHWGAAADACGSTSGCKPRAPIAKVSCPAMFENGKLAITDVAEAERLRVNLVDGVFTPWFELGRAPTPTEVGARLKLDPAATNLMLDKLAACGQHDTSAFGIHRVPESELIAVAWPLANVPTGIDVTLEGKKTVHARCAIDALGISKMMGKKAVVEATMDDGVTLRAEVDGDTLVSATPAEAVVFKGGSCDQMMFFSSATALDQWKKKKTETGGTPASSQGKTYTLVEAVKHGADSFGRMTQPIHGS